VPSVAKAHLLAGRARCLRLALMVDGRVHGVLNAAPVLVLLARQLRTGVHWPLRLALTRGQGLLARPTADGALVGLDSYASLFARSSSTQTDAGPGVDGQKGLGGRFQVHVWRAGHGFGTDSSAWHYRTRKAVAAFGAVTAASCGTVAQGAKKHSLFLVTISQASGCSGVRPIGPFYEPRSDALRALTVRV